MAAGDGFGLEAGEGLRNLEKYCCQEACISVYY